MENYPAFSQGQVQASIPEQGLHGPRFFLATDTPEWGEREQRDMFKEFAETPEQVDDTTKFFYGNTKVLVTKQSCKLAGSEREVR